jgi:hypothetical protein
MNVAANSSPRRRGLATSAVLVVLALAAFGVFGAAAAPDQTPGNVATQWNLIAASTLNAIPGPAGGAPPASAISMGMVQGAVYDAVNAIAGPKYRKPYLLKRRFAKTSSKRAAAVTAAYKVLSNVVSTVPENLAFPAKATVLQTLESQYAASLAAIPDSPSKVRGVAAGNAAANAMITARQGDGRFGPSQWVPNSAAGHWQPQVNPATGQQILDPTPWAGGVKPFLLQSSSQFRTSTPPALNSPEYAREFNEVKSIGSATSTTRTADQTYIARWWQTPPLKNWNDVARDLIGRSALDIVDSARLLAMQNLTAADAAINCWNDKYHYDQWRPWNAIPRAAEDGNDATAPQAGWAPLISAPYPDTPSGANCLNSAHIAVLRMVFGDVIDNGFDITSVSAALPAGSATTRHFDTFSQPLAELIEARIWAGLHFRFGDVQAQKLGMNVANYMAANYFQPVAN